MLKKVFLSVACLVGLSSVAFADASMVPTNINNYIKDNPHTIYVTSSNPDSGQPFDTNVEVDYNVLLPVIWNYEENSYVYKYDTLNFSYKGDDGQLHPCLNGVIAGYYIMPWVKSRNVNVDKCDANGFHYNENLS